eukprot:SAG31_NODE_6600_length_1956_cov_1.208401_1_plen_89_part_00
MCADGNEMEAEELFSAELRRILAAIELTTAMKARTRTPPELQELCGAARLFGSALSALTEARGRADDAKEIVDRVENTCARFDRPNNM